ncbi:MAG: HIT domain-containing protein [Clostridium sp.]|nr:HIT domain-containing protein [Clostridium sp.]MCM1444600.1 HIT domain-containing protein [Candidatus Amulumruptor caecigallinarius]
MNCLFCKIINNEVPSYKIYEDDTVFVFLDINPDSVGHTLIIPKQHYKDLDDIDNETLIHIMDIARKIKNLLQEKLGIDGITLMQNNGDVQEIKHFHLHLKPFYNTKTNMSVEETYNIIKNI